MVQQENKRVMKELDKKEIYYVGDLTANQLEELTTKYNVSKDGLDDNCIGFSKTYHEWWYVGKIEDFTNPRAIINATTLFKQEIKKGQIWEHIKTGQRVEVDKVKDSSIFFKRGDYFGDVKNFDKYWKLVEEETKPQQYQIGIDTFARCEANMTKEEILACCKFNIDKYNWRQKNQDKQDLEKIIHYAQWALKQLK